MEWKFRERSEWRRWFAWYPVKVGYGKRVWLKTVWKRADPLNITLPIPWLEWWYKDQESDPTFDFLNLPSITSDTWSKYSMEDLK